MKKTRTDRRRLTSTDDLRPEYRFDYRKARPNRFAGRRDKNRVVVLLDPDVSKVFTSSESVNKVLRALVSTLPRRRNPRRAVPLSKAG